MFPKAEPRETLRFKRNKINGFLRDQSLRDWQNVRAKRRFCYIKVLFHILHFIKTGAKKIVCYTEDFVIQRFIISKFHCSWKMGSWKFIKPCCNDGCQSTFAVNSTLLPSDVIDFAMLPAQRFWQEKASLLDVM